MQVFRSIALVLAILQVIFAGFTGAVGALADGGEAQPRLLLIIVHPDRLARQQDLDSTRSHLPCTG